MTDDLRQRRARAAEQVADLEHQLRAVIEASRDSNADDEHDPEGSTIAFERAQLIALLEAARQQVGDLDAAMRRRAEGTYGTCEGCDRPIPAERLAVRPAATKCVSCAS